MNVIQSVNNTVLTPYEKKKNSAQKNKGSPNNKPNMNNMYIPTEAVDKLHNTIQKGNYYTLNNTTPITITNTEIGNDVVKEENEGQITKSNDEIKKVAIPYIQHNHFRHIKASIFMSNAPGQNSHHHNGLYPNKII